MLWSEFVIGETSAHGISKRIEEYIVNYLQRQGIQTVPEDALTPSDVKLTVKLNSIDAVEVRDSAPHSPTFIRQQPIIRYSALLTVNGMTRLDYSHHESNESLEYLCQEIGERIGERVARFYK